jgi:hypothetical protein
MPSVRKGRKSRGKSSPNTDVKTTLVFITSQWREGRVLPWAVWAGRRSRSQAGRRRRGSRTLPPGSTTWRSSSLHQCISTTWHITSLQCVVRLGRARAYNANSIFTKFWMRSSREWIRSIRASDCQCQSRNSPGFDPSILRHSGF